MNRDYDTGTVDNATFFIGVEVELTPSYGLPTLFVTGVQPVETIEQILEQNGIIEHIFFGANHSFNPGLTFPEAADEWDAWEHMITHFLKKNMLCSLDIPIVYAEAFLETGLTEYDAFIPQLRVPVPYIKQWNYNTMLKIDDKDFRASNPGVWCHSLHDLMDRSRFTDWSKYRGDKIVR